MNDPANGLDMLAVVCVVSFLLIAYAVAEWRRNDLRRRAERLLRRLEMRKELS